MPVSKLKSKIKWSQIKSLVKQGYKAADIENKFNGAVTKEQIYRKKAKWSKEEYYTSDKYAKFRTPKYIEWRKSVLKRDNYRCVVCKRGRPARLEVDHIYSWARYPDLRFDVDNGQTLCHSCHKRTPTYGRKATFYVCSYEKNTEWVRSEKERLSLIKLQKSLKKL